MPPAIVRANTPVSDFLDLVTSRPNRTACEDAIEWLSDPRFEGQNMGFAMQTFREEAHRNGPHESWAVWNLVCWRHRLSKLLRLGFLLSVLDPMTCYRLVKHASGDDAGDDWDDEERGRLRERFRGKLPNVPDSETI